MVFKFALRNIRKRPLLNLTKVLGLGLALAGTLIIVLFLKYELTFDNFHNNSDRIYRLTVTNQEFLGGKHFARIANPSFVPEMEAYFPQIENFVRLIPIFGGVIKRDKKFIEVSQAFQSDSSFFDLFNAELLIGNRDKVLTNPGSIVLSESFAKKLFGEMNPVGEILTLPSGQFYEHSTDFNVVGIMKDFPARSHFHPEFIATPKDNNEFNRWAWTYLLLNKNANPNGIITGFRDFSLLHVENASENNHSQAHLQQITDIHLHSDKLREIEPNNNMSVIYTLSMGAMLLLIIAIFNYLNLSMGMSVFSEKYLYLGKVFGFSKSTNVKYYFSEGIIIAFASIIICGIILAFTHNFVQQQFGLNLLQNNSPLIILVLVLFSLMSVISAVLMLLKQGLSNIKPNLNYTGKNNFNKGRINKGLLVLQYTISIFLIVAVIVIQRQTNYAMKSSLGSENSNLICFENVHANVQQKFEIFKEELLQYNSIETISAMMAPPGGETNDMFSFTMEGYRKNEANSEEDRIGVFPCDYSFAKIFNLQFLSGKNFTEDNEDNQGMGEYILNESAMNQLDYVDPEKIVGKEFGLFFDYEGINIPKGRIIGVVKDFHLYSVKKKIEPLVLFKRKDLWLINFVVSFRAGLETKALSDIEKVWKNVFPEHPFNYEFVSAMYKNVYKREILEARLLSVFTFIALFIGTMGLLGISLLITQRRSKEIGIRKVNGAKIGQIIKMLNWDILKWILLSSLIAIPFALMAMKNWLENFEYKITLDWWIFATGGLVALLISTVTITLQSWKSATSNPVDALRHE